MSEIRIRPGVTASAEEVFGIFDSNLQAVEKDCKVQVFCRGDDIIINGEEAERASLVITEMFKVVESGQPLDEQKVAYIIALSRDGISYTQSNLAKDVLCFTHRGRPIKAKTLGQREYVDAIRQNDITFGIGPAGTGKTYIAVAMAVNALKDKDVEKLILARPAVEAGERLGFLPGDLQEKVDPYLRPLYDALYDIMGREATLRLKEKETIEVVPLAYMRGRTLDNAFIILDEAQNATKEQMKMFLTRMGFGSKVIVTGDITQVDLPRGKRSGLTDAMHVLAGVDGIAFCRLTDSDVVRHPLVRRIVNAYEKYLEEHPQWAEEE
ncbi:MAG: PhoH family protein [Firmicutes bacterium]|nr:PhoH family protein [Bacillota bacterium]MBQ4370795.1 PhoH family protein [Bacillota bacterium]